VRERERSLPYKLQVNEPKIWGYANILPQTHNATDKCVESLLNKKRKRKTGCNLLSISPICKDIVPTLR